HRAGMLSKVLSTVAGYGGNVLTIHQSIPLQGMANVVISVEVTRLGDELGDMLEGMRDVAGVKRANLIGQG
ncbi:hypothetical protein BGX30_008363, partial [Mortierella sp. GBA39]